MSGALRDAGGFEAFIDSIHAQVTFNSLVVVRILHRDIPRAGFLTGHAADAFFLVDIDDAVSPLYHRVGRTDRNTERVFTMTTT